MLTSHSHASKNGLAVTRFNPARRPLTICELGRAVREERVRESARLLGSLLSPRSCAPALPLVIRCSSSPTVPRCVPLTAAASDQRQRSNRARLQGAVPRLITALRRRALTPSVAVVREQCPLSRSDERATNGLSARRAMRFPLLMPLCDCSFALAARAQSAARCSPHPQDSTAADCTVTTSQQHNAQQRSAVQQ